MDLIIENARLLEADGLFQIGIESGKISRLAKSIEDSSENRIDARSGLVLPTFVEPHVHLDKVLLAEQFKEASSISEARALVKSAKKNFTPENVKTRIERVIPWALESGVTAIRTHIDVDENTKLSSVEAMLDLKRKYSRILDFQIVAFPQEGLFKESGSIELLKKAIDLGCDVVGGLPEAEATNEDSRKHIDQTISLARETGLDIDSHCDVLTSGRNIEYYAKEIRKNGFAGRATADHLIALSYYDDEYASKVIHLIKQASINVVTNPCTMMTSGMNDPPPKGRGITRVRDLMQAGINVAFGSDNIVDPYNPLGDFNPLSNGFLLAYGGGLSSISELSSLIRMPTFNSSSILRLDSYGIKEGCNADLNVFKESSVRELLRRHGRPSHVLKRGEVLVENTVETTHSRF